MAPKLTVLQELLHPACSYCSAWCQPHTLSASLSHKRKLQMRCPSLIFSLKKYAMSPKQLCMALHSPGMIKALDRPATDPLTSVQVAYHGAKEAQGIVR